MNQLAAMWAERELKRLEMIELRKLAKELRETQARARPMLEVFRKHRNARMRQDGPQGFIMTPQCETVAIKNEPEGGE